MPTRARKAILSAAVLLFANLFAVALVDAQAADTRAKRDPRIDAVLDNLDKVRAIHQTAISPDGKLPQLRRPRTPPRRNRARPRLVPEIHAGPIGAPETGSAPCFSVP